MGIQHAKAELNGSWIAYTLWQAKEFDESTLTHSLFKTMPPKIIRILSMMSKKNVQVCFTTNLSI